MENAKRENSTQATLPKELQQYFEEQKREIAAGFVSHDYLHKKDLHATTQCSK